MKKFNILYIALIVLFAWLFASCASNHFTFTDVEGSLYAMGTQTITVTTSDDAKFEEKLETSYVTLSEQLKGKTVDSIKYISETKAEITISGKLENYTENSNYTYYNIELSSKALKGNTTATVVTKVYLCSPKILALSVFFTTDKMATSKFSLDYGSFIEENCNTSNIKLPDSNGVIISVTVNSDNTLTISVENYISSEESKYPLVKISANCTTFNQDIYVSVGQMLFSTYIYK